MKKISGIMWMMLALLTGVSLTSCDDVVEDNPVTPTNVDPTVDEGVRLLQSAQEEGAEVGFSYSIDGVNYVANFKLENNQFVLEQTPTRAGAVADAGGDFVPYVVTVGAEGSTDDPNAEDDGDWDDEEETWLDGYGDDGVEEGDDIEEDWITDDDEEEEEEDDPEAGEDPEEEDDGEIEWAEDDDDDNDNNGNGSGSSARVVTRGFTRAYHPGGMIICGVRDMRTGYDRIQARFDIDRGGVCQVVQASRYDAVMTRSDDPSSITFGGSLTINGKRVNVTLDPNSGIGDMVATKVSFKNKNCKLDEGKTKKIQAKVWPANIPDNYLMLTSSDDKVATIKATNNNPLDGKTKKRYFKYGCILTALCSGQAAITFGQESGIYAKLDVNVRGVKKIKITDKKPKLNVGDTHQFSVEVSPATAKIQEVTWSSDNPNVAYINQKGLVTALLPGKAHIIAISKDGNKKSQYQIKVVDPTIAKVKYIIKFDKIEKSLINSFTVGKTMQLSYTISLKKQIITNLDDIGVTDITWYSNNESVATVDQDGLVTAVFPGTTKICVITAPHGVIGKCSIKVLGTHVKKVILDKTELTLTAGETSQLTATITPDNATIKDVTWTSDNEKVARVDANGKVTALSAGLATITVTTVDKGKKATCQVFVNNAATNHLAAPDDFESGGNPF